MRRLGFDAFVLVCAAVAFLDLSGVEEYELGGAEGGAVPEEGRTCAGDGGYVEGHLDGLVVDDLIGALGEAVPAFGVGF